MEARFSVLSRPTTRHSQPPANGYRVSLEGKEAREWCCISDSHLYTPRRGKGFTRIFRLYSNLDNYVRNSGNTTINCHCISDVVQHDEYKKLVGSEKDTYFISSLVKVSKSLDGETAVDVSIGKRENEMDFRETCY